MRQLATRRSKTATLRYSHTALVVTDASGFTAWTTRTSPLDVIHTLSRMFRELDAAAVSWGVEKVCTVGDSYVGAVFGPCQQQHGDDKDGGSTLSADQNSSDREDGDSSVAARRALTGLQFAFDVVRLPQRIGLPLRSRVGVHVGTVYAGFVGFSPPVFDVFGVAVTEAKALEGSGAPSRVHVSRVALSLCESNGLGSGVDAVATARGVLLRAWTTQLAEDTDTSIEELVPVRNNAAPGTPPAQKKCEEVSPVRVDAPAMVAALRRLKSGSDADELFSLDSLIVLPRHKYRRTFVDADMERRYLQHIQREAPYEYAMCLICFFLGLTSAIYYMTYSCSDTATDRWIVCVFLFTMMGYYLTLHTPRLSGVARLVIGTLCFDVCSVYAFYSQDCVLSYERAVAMRNVYLVAAIARYLLPLVAVTLPLWMRFCSLGFVLVSSSIVEPFVRAAIQENVGVTISAGVALPIFGTVISAYVIDETLRRGFIAKEKVSWTLRTSGTYAKNTRATLEMMLPAHAADVVLQRAAQRLFTVGSRKVQDPGASDLHDLLDESIVWDYQTLAIAFISFDFVNLNALHKFGTKSPEPLRSPTSSFNGENDENTSTVMAAILNDMER
eukprot:PhM_4_TR9517/c2_g3_i11/m.98281